MGTHTTRVGPNASALIQRRQDITDYACYWGQCYLSHRTRLSERPPPASPPSMPHVDSDVEGWDISELPQARKEAKTLCLRPPQKHGTRVHRGWEVFHRYLYRDMTTANFSGMVMSPVHQVWPKPSCKAQWKGKEDKADRGRGTGGKTTPGNGQAWSSPSPRGQWRTGKNGGN